jgi:hypothetical protein
MVSEIADEISTNSRSASADKSRRGMFQNKSICSRGGQLKRRVLVV